MDRLITLRISLLYGFEYLRVFYYSIIDIQQQGFGFYSIQFSDDGLDFYVLNDLFGQVAKLIIREFGYDLKNFHFALRHLIVSEISG